MISPLLLKASARNIRCFFNERTAKSFTTDWLLIMMSSSDMACFHPYVIHRGGFVKLKRHHRPSLFMGKLRHSGRWCHAYRGRWRQSPGREVSFMNACIVKAWVIISLPKAKFNQIGIRAMKRDELRDKSMRDTAKTTCHFLKWEWKD